VAVLACTVVLHCTALYYTTPHCTVLHCTVLHCTVLYYTGLYYTALHCTVAYVPQSHCSHLCTAPQVNGRAGVEELGDLIEEAKKVPMLVVGGRILSPITQGL
jgi:hypothetical protein